jgi:hypothetical protein
MRGDKLPTEAEQQATYRRQREQFEIAYVRWVDGGKVGPMPPHPVRPHTPGPAIPESHIPYGDFEDE